MRNAMRSEVSEQYYALFNGIAETLKSKQTSRGQLMRLTYETLLSCNVFKSKSAKFEAEMAMKQACLKNGLYHYGKE